MVENGGSVNPSDLATLSLIGGYGGYGVGASRHGGYGGGNSLLAAEAHANGTAVKEAINCNSERSNDGLTRISEQNKEQACNDRANTTNTNITNQEFRSLDRLRDIERLIVDGQKEAAKCCCDAKLEACKSTSEIKALIIQENSATRELIRGDALAAANAKIVQLETINALKDNGHHHGH